MVKSLDAEAIGPLRGPIRFLLAFPRPHDELRPKSWTQKNEKMLYSPTKIQEVCASIVIGKESMSHMSRRLGLDIKEVVVWCALFRTYGAEVFTSPQDFDISLRERIVEDHLKNGLSLTQTCVKYKILRRSTLRNWIHLYQSGSPLLMRKRKKKDEPSKSDAELRIEELERELLLARAENAYLKKLRALMQENQRPSDAQGS